MLKSYKFDSRRIPIQEVEQKDLVLAPTILAYGLNAWALARSTASTVTISAASTLSRPLCVA
jgi:hypothetical protein